MTLTSNSDEPHDTPHPVTPAQPWWQKWKQLFCKPARSGIHSREALIEEIRQAYKKGLIAADALGMIEGVMQVDHLQARNIMLARSQIQFIQRDSSFREILQQVMESGHSRYPVIDENRDDIVGILHAKDLLKSIGKENEFDIDDILRPPLYSSETQRLNELLTEFKKSRTHMAIIVDEYGGISGLVTIEDVLEQIVGQIDDEHDIDDKPNIQKLDEQHYSVNALTPIEEFNQYFKASENTDTFDTIGGLITHRMGRIPRQSEQLETADFTYTVVSCDGRRIKMLEVTPRSADSTTDKKTQ